MLNTILFSLALMISLFITMTIVIEFMRDFKIYYWEILVWAISLTAAITHIIGLW